MKAWRWARAWEPIDRPSHNELQSFDSKFPPISPQRSCVYYTVTPPCRGVFIVFEVGRILASWGMAAQVNGLEQEDGRWNESSGSFLGEGKWQQSLKVMHSHCDLDDCRFVFQLSFSPFLRWFLLKMRVLREHQALKWTNNVNNRWRISTCATWKRLKCKSEVLKKHASWTFCDGSNDNTRDLQGILLLKVKYSSLYNFSWMEACLKEELPETTEIEEALRNGVLLAKLGNFFSPETVPWRKIFDKDLKVANVSFLVRAVVFNVFVHVSKKILSNVLKLKVVSFVHLE